MAREAIYGSYGDVKFYGIGQLSFIFWCKTNGIEVTNNTEDKTFTNKNGDKSIKPVFILPEYGLYLDVRSIGNEPNYISQYNRDLRRAVSEHAKEFTFLYSEKFGALDFFNAKALIAQTPEIEVNVQVQTVLDRLQSDVDRKVALVSMPRWFKTKLREIRKEKNKV